MQTLPWPTPLLSSSTSTTARLAYNHQPRLHRSIVGPYHFEVRPSLHLTAHTHTLSTVDVHYSISPSPSLSPHHSMPTRQRWMPS
jgi:hypothetical protein